jgi:hypothetical protein
MMSMGERITWALLAGVLAACLVLLIAHDMRSTAAALDPVFMYQVR